MTLALIDSDLVAYRCSASAENEEEFVALYRVDELMRRLLHELSAEDYAAYLTGSNNFRYKVNPEYKANRKDVPKPKWLEACRTHLVTEWKASVTDGNEADDELGIAFNKSPDNSIIVSLDKDLLQIPGRHYSWEISGSNRGTQWTRSAELRTIGEREGLFNFYWQLVMGDKSDNIFGFDGKARATVPKFMEPWYEEMQCAETEKELYNYVLDLYDQDLGRMIQNGRCLWIQREENDDWLNRVKRLMADNGQEVDITHSLPLSSVEESDVGNLNMTP